MEGVFARNGELDATIQPDLERKEDVGHVKTHEEIIEMIDELKELEERYGEFEIIDIEVTEELIEVEHSELADSEKLVSESETKKQSLSKKLKKYQVFRIKVRRRSDTIVDKKPVKTATFKIRFDESGNLVNTDFRKVKPKKPSKFKTKIVGKLPKLKYGGLKRKGKKGAAKSETGSDEVKDKESKGSKLKGKIGKLKKVIPNKGKKKEKKSKK